jgi:glycosyltransferase involved in cell wall biosynthesis
MNSTVFISVVVPVFNEEENVESLHREIVGVLETMKVPFEIIFVNDGSSDQTGQVLQRLSPLKVITFRKNFGQTSALDAGFKESCGEYIVAMDGDGQNDPADIPRLLEHVEKNNLDVVSGWRKNRQDNKNKRFISRVANRLRKLLIDDGIHDSGCTLKIYRKECFQYIDLYGEMHRFIPATLKIKGFTVGEIVVNHRPRIAGVTKYTWKRAVKGFLDMISVWFWKKFANRPLHLFGGAGALLMFLGAAAFCFVVVQALVFGRDLSDTALTIISLFILFTGVQLFVFGLLADILSKNYFAASKDMPYVIKEVTKNE